MHWRGGRPRGVGGVGSGKADWGPLSAGPPGLLRLSHSEFVIGVGPGGPAVGSGSRIWWCGGCRAPVLRGKGRRILDFGFGICEWERRGKDGEMEGRRDGGKERSARCESKTCCGRLVFGWAVVFAGQTLVDQKPAAEQEHAEGRTDDE